MVTIAPSYRLMYPRKDVDAGIAITNHVTVHRPDACQPLVELFVMLVSRCVGSAYDCATVSEAVIQGFVRAPQGALKYEVSTVTVECWLGCRRLCKARVTSRC